MKHFLLAASLVCAVACAKAQMVEGEDIPEFFATFNLDKNSDKGVTAYLVASSAKGNILWPGEQAALTIYVDNKTSDTVSLAMRVDIIAYGTRGRPGDIWVPEMFKMADVGSSTVQVRLPGRVSRAYTVTPALPERFGAYAVVADLGQYGRRFITSVARTFASPFRRLQYPSFCLDDNSNDVLQRLGVHAIRHGVDYHPTTDPDFEKWYDEERQRMLAYQQAGISVLVKMSAPQAYGKFHPLGMPRPWLDADGVMQNTKTDMAWMPQYDDDFKKLVLRLATEFGWPKGPINAFALWNEPWEGISISGWAADIQRYREIYTKMAEAVEEARRTAGVDVLVGGCSSTSNALDKLFADGSDEFLDRFDFCSIHYQGMSASSTIRKWVDRQSPRGRVKIWDTESWVANTDDRVAAVVATNRSAGYDRAMGVYWGNICHVRTQPYVDGDGNSRQAEVTHAWSVAPAIGATQHFIGERPFRELLFKRGLPWISVFDGEHGNKEDGTLVVVGDIGEAFGPGNILFRTARGLKEQENEAALKARLKQLDPVKDAAAIKQILASINVNETLTGGTMQFADKGIFSLYDFYGNVVPPENGLITVPLDGRGFFLRTDGSPGSFDKLIDAVKQSRIDGIEPLETIALDWTAPLREKPNLTLRLTNVLNRSISGTLSVMVNGVTFDRPSVLLAFKPHEQRVITFKVKSHVLSTENKYPLSLVFDAGTDGKALHEETLHVNVIERRTIAVDGTLDDWEGAAPQVVEGSEASSTSLTEAAWFPFKTFKAETTGGKALGYMGYDDQYFYFAARIHDDSPDDGMRRFETLDADEFFYPDTAYIPYNGFRFGGAMKHDGVSFSARWTGWVVPPRTGTYTVGLQAKGSARLWVDGKLIVDAWHAGGERVAQLVLDRRKRYAIKIEYSKEWGDGALQLFWQGPKVKRQPIGRSDLVADAAGRTPGLAAEYFHGPDFNASNTKRIDNAIDFTWADSDVPDGAFAGKRIPLVWPTGVRRYSYRKDTETPFGNFADHDNVQLAFNVLDDADKDKYPFPPGTMKGYTDYQCTDYEYALNPVAPRYGGGTEVWRARVPGMPHKHFFPRQQKSPLDGPVKDAKLVITRDSSMRIVECAIPWSEIPHVKGRLEKGQTIKFSFRVNDNTPHGIMELAYNRSVSKINGAFKVDWKEHWANEIEFSFK